MDDPNFWLTIFSTEAIIALFIGLATLVLALQQRRLARLAAAKDVFDLLYSPENYTRRVQPVVTTMLKWHGLEGATAQRYRDAVMAGWLGFRQRPGELLHIYAGDGVDGQDHYEVHFREQKNTECITEHEALTSFLNYWVSVHALIESHVVDRHLTRRLLKAPFGVYKDFLGEMRSEIRGQSKRKDNELPPWVAATEALEEWFAK